MTPEERREEEHLIRELVEFENYDFPEWIGWALSGILVVICGCIVLWK